MVSWIAAGALIAGVLVAGTALIADPPPVAPAAWNTGAVEPPPSLGLHLARHERHRGCDDAIGGEAAGLLVADRCF